MATLSTNNISVLSPKWFRITKKVISWVSTLTISILMLYIPEDSKTLLIIKLCQSGAMELLDMLMAETQTPNNE